MERRNKLLWRNVFFGLFFSSPKYLDSISKKFEDLILSADKKLIVLNWPTPETVTTSTCIDHVITTPRLIRSKIYEENMIKFVCGVSYHYGILFVTGETIIRLRSKSVNGDVKDIEYPEIARKVLFMAKHFLRRLDFNTIDLEKRWKLLAQILMDFMNRFIPLKTREDQFKMNWKNIRNILNSIWFLKTWVC